MSVCIEVIPDKYAITSDKRQWMIAYRTYRKNPDTGESVPEWRGKHFYSELDHAVSELGKMLLRESDAASADDLIEEARKINKLLTFKFKKLLEHEK